MLHLLIFKIQNDFLDGQDIKHSTTVNTLFWAGARLKFTMPSNKQYFAVVAAAVKLDKAHQMKLDVMKEKWYNRPMTTIRAQGGTDVSSPAICKWLFFI